MNRFVLVMIFWGFFSTASIARAADRPFGIQVIDEATGRGVPLIELRTVNDIKLVTDSNGYVAFDEPGLMGSSVFFHVKGHGYEYPKDGFGYRGKALDVITGAESVLKVKRINIAERLYRETGAGIYRDTILLGKTPPVTDGLLNAKVFGSDSVVTTLAGDRLLWFWGDTNRPGYPLGNFDVPHAITPGPGRIDPDKGIDFAYEKDAKTGFARPSAKMPGQGPTWIFGLTTVKDPRDHGRERVFAGYLKVRPPMEVYERGICEYDYAHREFKRVKAFSKQVGVFPDGQPLAVVVGGTEYRYFATGYPFSRVKADPESYVDETAYESYTPLKPGTVGDKPDLEVDSAGRSIWAWKRGTRPIRPQEQRDLIRRGLMKSEDGLLALRDVDTGKEVLGHAGSVYWNEYRKRWVMIICEFFGSSLLGETWFSEARSPLGPWVYARKVVTHEKYSFYNPKQHPYFAKENGRIIYFEGTYTTSFSGNTEPTPRYEYNQIMYKLDLSDERLNLPEPIRGIPTQGGTLFQAKTRPGDGLIPVYHDSGRLLLEKPTADARPAFFAPPHDLANAPATTVVLREVERDGRRSYVTDTKSEGRPLCRVWRHPLRIDIPESEWGATP